MLTKILYALESRTVTIHSKEGSWEDILTNPEVGFWKVYETVFTPDQIYGFRIVIDGEGFEKEIFLKGFEDAE